MTFEMEVLGVPAPPQLEPLPPLLPPGASPHAELRAPRGLRPGSRARYTALAQGRHRVEGRLRAAGSGTPRGWGGGGWTW